MSDYYQLLGVPRDATEAQIKTAYRALSKRIHPDAGGSAEEFAKVTAAYNTLAKESSRQYYDFELKSKEEKAKAAQAATYPPCQTTAPRQAPAQTSYGQQQPYTRSTTDESYVQVTPEQVKQSVSRALFITTTYLYVAALPLIAYAVNAALAVLWRKPEIPWYLKRVQEIALSPKGLIVALFLSAVAFALEFYTVVGRNLRLSTKNKALRWGVYTTVAAVLAFLPYFSYTWAWFMVPLWAGIGAGLGYIKQTTDNNKRRR